MDIVNRQIPKVDGKGILLGKPVYTDDISPKDALVVKVLRSPHAFARIVSVDKSIAEKVPGIECILSHEDVPRIAFTRAGQSHPEPSSYDKYILDSYVRYVGDGVSIVAGENEACVDKAMKLIKVEYEILEPVLDYESAKDNKSVIHNKDEVRSIIDIGQDFDRNIASRVDTNMNDVEKILEECDIVIKRRYYSQETHQSMLETFRTTTYIDQNGRLVVIDSTQIPFHVRRILARALDIPSSKIRVIKPRIGAGFGAKQTMNSEFYPALVSLKTGRAAKIIYSTKEMFDVGTPRHPMRFDVTIGASKDGRIRAIDLEGLSDTGAYGEHAYTIFHQAGTMTLNLYNKLEAARFRGDVVYTNTTPKGAFRGYGATQGMYAVESAVNELAGELDICPTVIRDMNMVAEGEYLMKYEENGVMDDSPAELSESCKLDYCLKRAKELIDWDSKFGAKKEGTIVRGVGMAIARQGSGIVGIDMAAATLNLCDDGSFTLLVGATDIGTGSDTILSQICGETLGVDFEDINIVSSDTDTTPYDGGAYASSTTYVTGNAVRKAAENMRKSILEEGAKALGTSIEKVSFDGKFISLNGYDKKIPLRDLASDLIYGSMQLTSSGSYLSHKSPPPYMVGIAEVEVDLETGRISPIDFVSVLDVGTVVNPKLARTQAEGGIVQGIGMALWEDSLRSRDGSLINNNHMKYSLPTRNRIGNIRVEFADSYEPTGPFGAKSIGEVVINTSSPAIQEAVYNATGVRVRSLPITPEKLLRELNRNK